MVESGPSFQSPWSSLTIPRSHLAFLDCALQSWRWFVPAPTEVTLLGLLLWRLLVRACACLNPTPAEVTDSGLLQQRLLTWAWSSGGCSSGLLQRRSLAGPCFAEVISSGLFPHMSLTRACSGGGFCLKPGQVEVTGSDLLLQSLLAQPGPAEVPYLYSYEYIIVRELIQ